MRNRSSGSPIKARNRTTKAQRRPEDKSLQLLKFDPLLCSGTPKVAGEGHVTNLCAFVPWCLGALVSWWFPSLFALNAYILAKTLQLFE
ncbi:hypothetical protein ACFL2Q_13455 [Thermodesulfobacteriota bacterium]